MGCMLLFGFISPFLLRFRRSHRALQGVYLCSTEDFLRNVSNLDPFTLKNGKLELRVLRLQLCDGLTGGFDANLDNRQVVRSTTM